MRSWSYYIARSNYAWLSCVLLIGISGANFFKMSIQFRFSAADWLTIFYLGLTQHCSLDENQSQSFQEIYIRIMGGRMRSKYISPNKYIQRGGGIKAIIFISQRSYLSSTISPYIESSKVGSWAMCVCAENHGQNIKPVTLDGRKRPTRNIIYKARVGCYCCFTIIDGGTNES